MGGHWLGRVRWKDRQTSRDFPLLLFNATREKGSTPLMARDAEDELLRDQKTWSSKYS